MGRRNCGGLFPLPRWGSFRRRRWTTGFAQPDCHRASLHPWLHSTAPSGAEEWSPENQVPPSHSGVPDRGIVGRKTARKICHTQRDLSGHQLRLTTPDGGKSLHANDAKRAAHAVSGNREQRPLTSCAALQSAHLDQKAHARTIRSRHSCNVLVALRVSITSFACGTIAAQS